MNKDELTKMLEEQTETIEKIKEQPTHNDLKEFYLSKYQEIYQDIFSILPQNIKTATALPKCS